IRDETGTIVGIWEVSIGITAYAQRQQKAAEDALGVSEAREAFLLRLSDALRVLAEPVAMQTTACRMVGEHLRVNRCSYGEISGGEVVPRATWGRGDAPPTDRFALGEPSPAATQAVLAGPATAAEALA